MRADIQTDRHTDTLIQYFALLLGQSNDIADICKVRITESVTTNEQKVVAITRWQHCMVCFASVKM